MCIATLLSYNEYMKPELLLQIKRANIIEREHYGFIYLIDKFENILSKIGDDEKAPFFPRSSAKPFQALPLILTDTYKNFNLTLEELAVTCASHTGTNRHIELVRSILSKAGLSEEALQCGIHDPIDKETRHNLITNNLTPSLIHNNCSGKHAGMLAVCANKGWNIKNYLDFDHPLQQMILHVIKKYCNIRDNLVKSLDGCSAPVYAIPHHKMGSGLLNLFLSKEGKLIKRAYTEYPFLTGGNERLDTSIIEASKGMLVSKVGAEGLSVVINPQEEKALVVKIIDANMHARGIVVIDCLKQLGWLSKDEIKSESIQKQYNLEIKTLNYNLVGSIKPVFKLI